MPPVECCRLWPMAAALQSSSLGGQVWSNPLRPPTPIPFLVRFQEEREKRQALLPGEPPTDSRRCHPLLPCLLEESLLPRFHPGSSEGWSIKPPVEHLLPQVCSLTPFNYVSFSKSMIIVIMWFSTHYNGLWHLFLTEQWSKIACSSA